MSVDKIDLTNDIMKYCPSCGSKDVAIYGELLKCHRCFKLFGAFELEEEFGE